MTTATLSKTAVKKATEIAQNLNANAVIIEVKIGEKMQQMAISEESYEDIVCKNYEVIATITPTGAIS